MLEIRTLGSLSIVKDGKPVKALGSHKAEALLVYLAVEGGRQPRAVLAALFWPESTESRAATSLRVALSALRKSLAPYLEISRDLVGLNPKARVNVDVIELEDVLANGAVDCALEIYGGDFLRGFDIRESQPFDEWRLIVQERCRRLLQDGLHACIVRKLREGDTKAGLEFAHRLLELDPLDEIANKQCMQILAMEGRRSAALVQYEKYCAHLQNELGVKPSKGIRALFQQIANGEALTKPVLVQPQHNLPSERSTFVGREVELAQIGAMIADPGRRLVSLIGPGGIGKTRVALKAAGNSLHCFENGTYWVPLGSVPSPEALIPAVAETLSFSFDPIGTTSAPKKQLMEFLHDRSLLLVLDGFEHLLSSAAVLSELLAYAPGLHILVTSRARLGLQGEWVFHLEGLPVDGGALGADSERPEAVVLFCERAKQVRADFEPTEIEHKDIREICRLLDGMPLGIELAAAWVSTLSCREIAEEIRKNLDFLSTSMLDLPEKHSGLRAVFDHSWQLLSPEERETFRMLSVFCGGFERDAVQVVDVGLSQLSSLVQKSVLRRTDTGRFEIHDTLRQYAKEKLGQKPERKESVHDRHARYYVEFLRQRENGLMGHRMTRVREQIRRELGNILEAMNWALRNWGIQEASEAIEALFTFYAVQGWHEGKEAYARLVDQTAETEIGAEGGMPSANPIQLSLQAHQGFFLSNLGLVEESEEISRACLSRLQKASRPIEESLCLHNLGLNACFRGEYDLSINRLEQAIETGSARRTVAWRSYFLWLGYVYFMIGEYELGMENLQTSYELFDEIGSLWGKAFALSKMGLAANGLKAYDQAMRYYEEARAIFETTGVRAGKGYTLSWMSMGASLKGDFDDAVRFGQVGYETFQEIGHRWGICASLCRLGFANIGLGYIEKAKEQLREALRVAHQHQMTPLIQHALVGMACALAREGEAGRAVELYQFVRNQPATPAIYLDMAARWFPDVGRMPGQEDAETAATALDSESLDSVIEQVLKG